MADIIIKQSESAALIQISGEIDLQCAPEMKTAFLSVLESGAETCVVDLSSIESIDFSFSELMLSFEKTMKAKNKSLIISNTVSDNKALLYFKDIGILFLFTFGERGNYGI
jgi:anti-anti-sigma factor